MKFALLFLVSFCLVAFGQNAWVSWFGPLSSTVGYAIFWLGMMEMQGLRRRIGAAIVWFIFVQAVQLSWMATTAYMGPLILAVYAGLLFVLGLQFGLLSYFVQKWWPGINLLHCAALSGLWVLLEWSRLLFFTGFTWNPAGLALTTFISSLQAASLFGIFGLSFWVIFVNLLSIRAYRKRSLASLALAVGCALFPFGYGWLQTSVFTASHDDRKISALLVQTNLWPEQRDYDPKKSEDYLSPFVQWDHLLQLLEKTNAGDVDLIVLPEGGLPNDAFYCCYSYKEMLKIWTKYFDAKEFPLLGEPLEKPMSKLVQHGDRSDWRVSNAFLVQAIANHFHCDVIAGIDDREPSRQYNAAFHFRPLLNHAARAEKRVLVPVGEYVPLKNWKLLSQFVADQFGISGSFEPGQEAKVFEGPVPIGISICYEETYSDLIRQLKGRGAQLFVNITNDVWFPYSKLSHQHFDHGMVRAVENGVPLIRACNTGITGGVDCFGRTLALQPEYQASALYLDVPLQTFFTPYSIWGDWAILLLSILFASILGWKTISCPKY